MSRKEFLRAKRSIRKMCIRVIREMDQLRTDIESWNANRRDAPPFDAGGDIATAALARRLLNLVETDQPIPDELWNRFIEQAEANANELG